MELGFARSGRFVLAALLACAAFAPAGQAATIHPNLTDDLTRTTPFGCGRDAPDTDHCTLREAITAALPGDTVSLEPPAPAGPYVLKNELEIVSDVTIRGNGARSTTVSGALCATTTCGVFNIASATVTISRLTIADGTRSGPCGGLGPCADGGGIRIRGASVPNPDAALTLTDSTVRDNTSTGTGGTGGFGGGINVGAGSLTVINSTITGNRATCVGCGGGGIGGGIYASFAAVNITNSTIAGNVAGDGTHAGYGGGFASQDTTLTVRSSTINGNTAEGSNVVLRGGNIDATPGTSYDIKDSIVANGIAAAGPNCVVSGNPTYPSSINSSGHNIDSLDECGFHAAGDKPNTNPQLGPLTDNGGQTDTQAITAGSPAFDGGSLDCPPPATDQRGFARPKGTACDIGAFELQVPTSPASDKTASDVEALRFERRTFAALGGGPSAIARKKKTPKGSRVSYTLAEDATVDFTVERSTKGRRKGGKCVTKRRKGKRCTIYKQVKGSFAQAGKKGANGFKFTGRVGDKKLRPASYRLVAIATDAAGNRGQAVRTAFRIKR